MAADSLLGSSAAMEAVRTLIAQAASCDTHVLITGEGGTGKTLAAKTIHQSSSRRDKPFVEVNCAAIPDTLIESELFGHKKGAFTGAVSSRKGRFEAASGGTILLDEIGDMSLSAQSKVLRAIQDKTIEPLGGEVSVTVDLRIMAATNRNLEKECAGGRFRKDLFFRLNVLFLRMPPLRERKEDIIPLFRHFLDQTDRAALVLKDGAEEYLVDYPWPGNIRELQNLAKRISVMAGGCESGPGELQKLLSLNPVNPGETEDRSSGGLPPEILGADYAQAKEIFEKRYLEFHFFRNRCIVSDMAEDTGLDAGTLKARLKHHNIPLRGR
jgi:two-component system nitrogen regulation response regulator NtrX